MANVCYNLQKNNPISDQYPLHRTLDEGGTCILEGAFFHGDHGQSFFTDFELHFQAPKSHAIDPLRVVLVGRAGILGQHAGEGRAEVRREDDLQRLAGVALRKAAGGVRVGIGVGKIGLDVKNGCAVQEVSPGDMKDRA